MSEPGQHIVKSFTQELDRLRDLLTEMGGMVESQLALATEAITKQDSEIASRAVRQDPSVDALERQAPLQLGQALAAEHHADPVAEPDVVAVVGDERGPGQITQHPPSMAGARRRGRR